MFTWIDMLLAAIIAAIFTVLIILFLFGATILEREGQAYQEGYYKGCGAKRPRTRGDKIRALTDEELAKKIVVLDLGEAPYCNPQNAKCIEMLAEGEEPTSEMCQQCCIKWLQQEE